MRIRRSMLAAALLFGAAVGAQPQAQAAISENYTFTSSVGCLATCPYWDATASSEQQSWNQSCVQPTNLASNLNGLDVFDKYVIVPANVKLMTWSVTPQIDYDLVVCANNQARAIVWSANTSTDTCATGVPLAGCTETVRLALNPTTPCSPGTVCVYSGDRILLRHWNWSDPAQQESGRIVWS